MLRAGLDPSRKKIDICLLSGSGDTSTNSPRRLTRMR